MTERVDDRPSRERLDGEPGRANEAAWSSRDGTMGPATVTNERLEAMPPTLNRVRLDGDGVLRDHRRGQFLAG